MDAADRIADAARFAVSRSPLPAFYPMRACTRVAPVGSVVLVQCYAVLRGFSRRTQGFLRHVKPETPGFFAAIGPRLRRRPLDNRLF